MNTVNPASEIRSYVSRFLCAAMILSAAPLAAQPLPSGPMDGGGGGAYVCRQNGAVQSSELIDLWEARNRPYKWADKAQVYKLTIPYSDESVNIQINRALAKLAALDPALAIRVRGLVEIVRRGTESLPPEISVQVPPDALAVYFKTGCPPEGMMYYDDVAGVLNIKQDVFDKLINKTNIAAAITHEALYKAFRDIRARNEYSGPIGDSTPIRRINACMYATEDCFGIAESEAQTGGANSIKCVSKDYTLYAKRMNGPAKVNGDYLTEFYSLEIVRAGPFTYRSPLRIRLEASTALKNGVRQTFASAVFSRMFSPLSAWMRDYTGIYNLGITSPRIETSRTGQLTDISNLEFSAMLIEGTETRLPAQTFTCTPN